MSPFWTTLVSVPSAGMHASVSVPRARAASAASGSSHASSPTAACMCARDAHARARDDEPEHLDARVRERRAGRERRGRGGRVGAVRLEDGEQDVERRLREQLRAHGGQQRLLHRGRDRAVLRVLRARRQENVRVGPERGARTRIGARRRAHANGANLASTASRPRSLYAAALACRGPYLRAARERTIAARGYRHVHGAHDLRPRSLDVRGPVRLRDQARLEDCALG
jgi:hypothetical protein